MKMRNPPSASTVSLARMTSAVPGRAGAGIGAGVPRSGMGRVTGIGIGNICGEGVGDGLGSGCGADNGGSNGGDGIGGKGGNGTRSWQPIAKVVKASFSSPKNHSPTAHTLKPGNASVSNVIMVSNPLPAGIT